MKNEKWKWINYIYLDIDQREIYMNSQLEFLIILVCKRFISRDV